MTPPSDIAGLSERLRDAAHDPTMGIAGYCLLVDEAAAALDSLSARVKELEELSSRSIARLAEATEPGSIGAFAARDQWKARALRAEQQRNEAYERAATAAWEAIDPSQEGISRTCAEEAVAAIRRLASGSEGGTPSSGSEG